MLCRWQDFDLVAGEMILSLPFVSACLLRDAVWLRRFPLVAAPLIANEHLAKDSFVEIAFKRGVKTLHGFVPPACVFPAFGSSVHSRTIAARARS